MQSLFYRNLLSSVSSDVRADVATWRRGVTRGTTGDARELEGSRGGMLNQPKVR